MRNNGTRDQSPAKSGEQASKEGLQVRKKDVIHPPDGPSTFYE